MSVVIDDAYEGDDIVVVDDLGFVDADGEPVGDVIQEEITSIDADGNEVTEYDTIYVPEGTA